MNKKNLHSLIETLKNYDKQIDLDTWQSSTDVPWKIACSLEELHPCGNKACVAGVLGLMPEFIAMGGFIDKGGCPKIHVGEYELMGHFAVSYFLGLDDTPCIEFFLDPIVYSHEDIDHWHKWRGLEAVEALTIMERYYDNGQMDEEYVFDYIGDLNNIVVRDTSGE